MAVEKYWDFNNQSILMLSRNLLVPNEENYKYDSYKNLEIMAKGCRKND